MGLGTATRRVTDSVRKMIPRLRHRMSPVEMDLAAYIRGNEPLLEALKGLARERIRGRELSPIPSDPVLCMATLARDKELRWFISKLEYICHSPIAVPTNEDGEQPG